MKLSRISILAVLVLSLSVSPSQIFAQVEVVSGGNVGIGNSSPSNKLTIGATSHSGYGLSIRNPTFGAVIETTGNTSNSAALWVRRYDDLVTLFRVENDGNVGIGTVTPGEKLEVAGNIFLKPADHYLKIYANTEGADSIVFTRSDDSHQASIGTTAFGKSILFKVGGTEIVRFGNDGNVGIGTTTPGYKLEVAGSIRATSFISNTATYADFVFGPDYKLSELSEVEAQIRANGHLPGIPSAADVKTQGIDLAAMQVKLLQKIEELTLHQIAQEKEIKALRSELRRLTVAHGRME